MVDHDPKGYTAVQLNNRTDHGWAVLDDVTGAIVTFDSGLAIRMTKIDAVALVDKRNASSLAKFAKAKAANDRPAKLVLVVI